jgi:2-keto-4-pentenoate hydratase/2-oxohepta-3-ene-1,7-dioic acid hydratase in catechol pathway
MTEFPVIFTKSWTTINALGGDIVVDQRATQKADWEAELGVVIGAGGANIFEADAIGYLSEGMALLPGDVILTGTAAGVGVWRQPHEFLTDGDVVEISCAGLGTLSNRVVERGA